jgi:hypothetical protein
MWKRVYPFAPRYLAGTPLPSVPPFLGVGERRVWSERLPNCGTTDDLCGWTSRVCAVVRDTCLHDPNVVGCAVVLAIYSIRTLFCTGLQ